MTFVCAVHESLMVFPPMGLCLFGHELGKNDSDNRNALTHLHFGQEYIFHFLKKASFSMPQSSSRSRNFFGIIGLQPFDEVHEKIFSGDKIFQIHNEDKVQVGLLL